MNAIKLVSLAVICASAVAANPLQGGHGGNNTVAAVPAIPVSSLHPTASEEVWNESDKLKISTCRCDILEDLRIIVETKSNCVEDTKAMRAELAKVAKYFGPTEERQLMYERFD